MKLSGGNLVLGDHLAILAGTTLSITRGAPLTLPSIIQAQKTFLEPGKASVG
jgi:hypothetical protein